MDNGKNKLAEQMNTSMQPNADGSDDDMEVTEEDYALTEEKDKLEAERLKEKYGIESDNGGEKKKRPKKNKRGEGKDTPTDKDKQLLEEVEAVRSFYELIEQKRLIRIVSTVLFICLAVVTLFNIGGYLQYVFVSEGGLVVEVANHEHSYTEFGRRIDGDCEHLGYTVYICNYPYCGAEWIQEDELYGNHKYRDTPIISDYESENGSKYKRYEYDCSICGGKNVVYIPLEAVDTAIVTLPSGNKED